jgi:hypothetical protein
VGEQRRNRRGVNSSGHGYGDGGALGHWENLACNRKLVALKGHDFSRAVNGSKQRRALAPEGSFSSCNYLKIHHLKHIALTKVASLAQSLKVLLNGFAANTPSDDVVNMQFETWR